MKSLVKLCSMFVVLLAGIAQAQELIPIPDMRIPDVPYASPGVEIGEPVMVEPPVMFEHPMMVEHPMFVDPVAYRGILFTRVKYTDVHEMSPCAAPKIITVKNPCAHEGGCEPATVCIEICVPTCGCEEVTCRRFGNRIRYDYGKYAVDVRIKRGYIQVDYQD